MSSRAVLILVVLSFGLPCVAFAGNTVYVDAQATGAPHDGSSWCNAFTTLDEALAVALPGDRIAVADGTYTPDTSGLPNPRTATFRLKRDVVVEGGFAGYGAANADARDPAMYVTILSGDRFDDDLPDFVNYADNVFHVVTVDDPNITETTVLDGFTIRGGYANGTLADRTDQGSGIHNFNGVNPFTGKPLVRNCMIKENWSANHGAVNDHGGMTLINCEFRDNHAGKWGGGLYVHENLTTTVTDCRFINNHTDGSSGGGGGAVNEGNTTFLRCLFDGNRSENNGGGIYNHGNAKVVTIACDLRNNYAAVDGGGMYSINFVQATISDCVFENNVAGRNGGGFWTLPARFSVVNTVFRRNTAATLPFGSGGGLYQISPNSDSDAPELTNSAFIANVANAGGAAFFYSARPIFTNCLIFGNITNNTAAISLGVNVGDGSHAVMNNTIVWGNGTPVEGSQLLLSSQSTIQIGHSCVQGWTGALGGAGNIGSNPNFVDPDGPDGILGTADDNLRLSLGSPSINAGDNSAIPPEVTTDLDGNPRIAFGIVDMGAYEFRCPGDIAAFYGDVNSDGTVNFTDITLVVDVFRGVPMSIPFDDADIAPCGGNGIVNFSDVSAALGAFRGLPPCPDTCN
jgi:predicted outer membrane repeat protein